MVQLNQENQEPRREPENDSKKTKKGAHNPRPDLLCGSLQGTLYAQSGKKDCTPEINTGRENMAPEDKMSMNYLLARSRHIFLAVVLVSLITLMIPVSVVKADSKVTFPDPNLEAAIREAIGKPSGDIYESDLSTSTFTTLHAESLGIEDLTGLQHCTSLRYLYLHSNQISDISALSGLAGLTDLYLHDNQIDDISALSGLTSPKVLDLQSNQITNIAPLAHLTTLTDLYLYGNQVTDISPLAHLTKLMDLRLGENQISDISPLAGLTNLTSLHLLGNRISNISPLSGLTRLLELYLYNNQISDLSPLVNNPGIGSGDSLDLRRNPLSSTSVSTCIPALEARGVEVSWGIPPDQPVNISPTSGATEVSLAPILQSSDFSDPETGDTHGASQWQITSTLGNYSNPVFDRDSDDTHLTSIEVPSGELDNSTTYYWRVRYKNSHGAWSEWSNETSFTTKGDSRSGLPFWIWIIVGVAALLLVGVGSYLLGKRRPAKL